MGAAAATWIGTTLSYFPGPLLTILVIASGYLAGMIWGGIAGVLKAKYYLNEVIVTVMMNYIAIYFQVYLVRGPMIDKAMPFWPASEFLPRAPGFPRSWLEAGCIQDCGWQLFLLSWYGCSSIACLWVSGYRLPGTARKLPNTAASMSVLLWCWPFQFPEVLQA